MDIYLIVVFIQGLIKSGLSNSIYGFINISGALTVVFIKFYINPVHS